ncbi:uncharacterized protein LOC111023283 [Momordica charantia]|uniref:Uncharacterized protein LOC111023283 n=1 Tax=Momordica charantia TaxID=3673 RepID=A0A6J1DRX6_MOMCH|nr:uncharacterized protein LOC111023283 [Momordica charantia]
MASSRCSLSSQLLLGLFFIFLIMGSTLGDPETEERINRVCRQMEEFGFCSQTFHENLKGPTDYVRLTQIAKVEAIINATRTLRYITKLLAFVSDPALKNNLIVCENAYDIMNKAFLEGIKYFFQRDYRSMVNAERIAPRAEASCSVIFGTPPERSSPLVERNREMRILIAMALVSASYIAS